MSLQGPQGGWVGWALAWGVWGMCGAHSGESGARSHLMRVPRVGIPLRNPHRGRLMLLTLSSNTRHTHFRHTKLLRGCGAGVLWLYLRPGGLCGPLQTSTYRHRVPERGGGAPVGGQRAMPLHFPAKCSYMIPRGRLTKTPNQVALSPATFLLRAKRVRAQKGIGARI